MSLMSLNTKNWPWGISRQMQPLGNRTQVERVKFTTEGIWSLVYFRQLPNTFISTSTWHQLKPNNSDVTTRQRQLAHYKRQWTPPSLRLYMTGNTVGRRRWACNQRQITSSRKCHLTLATATTKSYMHNQHWYSQRVKWNVILHRAYYRTTLFSTVIDLLMGGISGRCVAPEVQLISGRRGSTVNMRSNLAIQWFTHNIMVSIRW